jgi:hypothetical protein
MDIDERHCPNCGHDILNWDIACPGCDQVPWDSPTGWRVIKARRRRQFWSEQGPILGFLVLVGALVVIGNIHRVRLATMAWASREIERMVEEANGLERELASASPDSGRYEAVVASARRWLEEVIPRLLEVATDRRQAPHARAAAVMGIGSVFGELEQVGPLAALHREPVVRQLTPLLSGTDPDALKAMVAMTLGQVGTDEALRAVQAWRHDGSVADER